MFLSLTFFNIFFSKTHTTLELFVISNKSKNYCIMKQKTVVMRNLSIALFMYAIFGKEAISLITRLLSPEELMLFIEKTYQDEQSDETR